MVERRGGPRLVLESAQALGARRGELRQDLERDAAAEARVSGPVHLAHAAGAHESGDFVGTETDSRRKPHDRSAVVGRKLGRLYTSA